MTLIKRNSFLPTIPRFFDDFLSKDFYDWNANNNLPSNSTLPSVNIVESNDGFVVEMAAPGMNKKDFIIELDNETLMISSEKEFKNEIQEDDKYVRREFSYQSFQRSFHLPKSVVDESKIEAKYQDGVLRVMIPKREEAKALPIRQITVK